MKQPDEVPNTNEIEMYFHCALCLEEKPGNESPMSWQRIQVGFTKWGVQVWCVRHDCNIAHVDFQGKSPFPANTSRKAA